MQDVISGTAALVGAMVIVECDWIPLWDEAPFVQGTTDDAAQQFTPTPKSIGVGFALLGEGTAGVSPGREFGRQAMVAHKEVGGSVTNRGTAPTKITEVFSLDVSVKKGGSIDRVVEDFVYHSRAQKERPVCRMEATETDQLVPS